MKIRKLVSFIFLTIFLQGCEQNKISFLDLEKINKELSDSLSINLNKYKSILESSYSDEFIEDSILHEISSTLVDDYLIDLFRDNGLLTNYSDTTFARQDEISFQLMRIVFNSKDSIKDIYSLKREGIKQTYLSNIYVGSQLSGSVSIALISDLLQEGYLTNDELHSLLIIRFILMEVTTYATPEYK